MHLSREIAADSPSDATARLRCGLLAVPLVLALAWPAAALAASATPLQFIAGDAKMAAMLGRLSATREMVAEPFSVAMVDLNGDGRNEIIVRSDGRGFCGSGGCLTVVLEQQGALMVPLLSQNLFPGVGVTQERVGAYRALAALGPDGAIMVGERPGTPMFGKPLVYPMQAAAAAPAAVPAAATATTTAVATPSSGHAGARPWLPEVLGFKLGMDLQAVRARMGELRIGTASVPRTRTQVGEFTPGFMAMDPSAIETNEAGTFSFTFSVPPHSDKLIFVERQVRYLKMPGKAPVAADLTAALLQKFGTPTQRESLTQSTERLTWIWSPDGKLQPRGLGLSCTTFASGFSSYVGNTLPTVSPSQAAHVNKLLQSGCGVVTVATIERAPSGVVSTMSHHAVDMAGGMAARMAMTEAFNEQTQRKQQQDLDQARQQKPKI
jgi:hypothetical protein